MNVPDAEFGQVAHFVVREQGIDDLHDGHMRPPRAKLMPYPQALRVEHVL
jgi:hypothetical protein